jgi:outer membrane protein assembly factor BamB
MRSLLLYTVTVTLALAAPLRADGPTGWRGDGSGRFPNASPPPEWSAARNVAWSTPLPSWSNASPAVSGRRVFVCAEPATLICVDAADGNILWERSNTYFDLLDPDEAARALHSFEQAQTLREQLSRLQRALRGAQSQLAGQPDDKQAQSLVADLTGQVEQLRQQIEELDAFEMPPTHATNGYSTPTPAADQRAVYAVFGTGVVACYDHDGNRRWIKRAGRPGAGHGYSSSPVLAGDLLLVLMGDLLALDTATGQERWRAPCRQRHGTPVLANWGEAQVAVTPDGDVLDVANGTVLAKNIGAVNYCAPIAHGDVVYFVEGRATAVRLTRGEDGKLEPKTLWRAELPADRYFASPVWHDGLLYALNNKGEFSVMDAATGEIVHQRTLDLGRGGTVFSSLAIAGNRLYATGENGTTIVMQADRDAKELARNQLTRLRSTPVFDGNRIFFRTRDTLYCIAAP